MRKSGADSKSGQWFDILKVAGNLDPKGKTPFTTQELAERAKLQPTTKTVEGKQETVSTANQIAAAWLLKFKKWGYVEVAGQVEGSGTRPMNAWRMTEKGRNCELRESLQSRFDRLLEALGNYRDAKGKKEEPAAWKALEETLDEEISS